MTSQCVRVSVGNIIMIVHRWVKGKEEGGKEKKKKGKAGIQNNIIICFNSFVTF